MPLTEKQKRHLRQLAHPKKPVVIIGGAGLTAPVLAEVEQALAHHELIKVRVNAEDREARDEMIDTMLAKTGADPVQRIGHIAILYRRGEKPRITFPEAG